jgi:DNA-nicking Smr family endonuclease
MGRKHRRGAEQRQQPARGKRRSIRHANDPEASGGRVSAETTPPAVHLRKLTVDEALQRLEFELRRLQRRGVREAVVIHGRGHNSPGGIPVLGPAVREWCGAHPQLVGSWQEAPRRLGGPGAIVVVLRREPGEEAT